MKNKRQEHCDGAYFRIATLAFRICNEAVLCKLDVCWDLFRENCQKTALIVVNYEADPSGYQNVETYPIEAKGKLIRLNEDLMFASEDWHKANIFCLRDKTTLSTFLAQLFYTHAVQRHMIQLHASLIDDHGRGIVFLGPSGIGKTTQAERWMQYRGASILNGDMVFVQETQGPDKQYLGWGTPWHGSSPYCLNASVPVKALVVLKQAPENRLRELTGFEKVAEASGSVFYPTWLENGMELCTDTLNHLLTDLPVYRLDNRADEAAINLLAAELDRIT